MAQAVAQPMREAASFAPAGIIIPGLDAAPYASFLKRFLAFLLDEFIAVGLAGITYAVMAMLAAGSAASTLRRGYASSYQTGVGLGAGFLFLVLGGVLAFAVYCFYFVRLETGPRQATLGKSLLGLRVQTATGGTISVGQSLGRLIIKSSFSGLFFGLGFLMAAFTEKKQALHDFIAATIVVER